MKRFLIGAPFAIAAGWCMGPMLEYIFTRKDVRPAFPSFYFMALVAISFFFFMIHPTESAK